MDVDIDLVAAELGEDLIGKIFSNEPVEVIAESLQAGAPIWYQSLSEGLSPLHAAAYVQNFDLAKFLLEKGALWNAVDHFKNTASDIALSFNNNSIYKIIRDAGIRSEILLGLLGSQPVNESSLILRDSDTSARNNLTSFLGSDLSYSTNGNDQDVCLLEVEGDEVGVMMGWEQNIMQESVNRLCVEHPKTSSLRVLNVGFGLGIIDHLFQNLPHPPKEHVIIEAHPQVLKFMREKGWYTKNGVKILKGRWQDVIETRGFLEISGFDVIYMDTFSEDYAGLKQFFERVPDLMADADSRFSFFNGLGATNTTFYDIYTHISEMDLSRIGLEVVWSDVDVSRDCHASWSKNREYFSVPLYRLPIGKMKATE